MKLPECKNCGPTVRGVDVNTGLCWTCSFPRPS